MAVAADETYVTESTRSTVVQFLKSPDMPSLVANIQESSTIVQIQRLDHLHPYGLSSRAVQFVVAFFSSAVYGGIPFGFCVVVKDLGGFRGVMGSIVALRLVPSA